MLESSLNSLKRLKLWSDCKNYFLREDYFLIKFLSFFTFPSKAIFLEDVICEKHCFPRQCIGGLDVQISLGKVQGCKLDCQSFSGRIEKLKQSSSMDSLFVFMRKGSWHLKKVDVSLVHFGTVRNLLDLSFEMNCVKKISVINVVDNMVQIPWGSFDVFPLTATMN